MIAPQPDAGRLQIAYDCDTKNASAQSTSVAVVKMVHLKPTPRSSLAQNNTLNYFLCGVIRAPTSLIFQLSDDDDQCHHRNVAAFMICHIWQPRLALSRLTHLLEATTRSNSYSIYSAIAKQNRNEHEYVQKTAKNVQ